jgi:hypothetical protein
LCELLLGSHHERPLTCTPPKRAAWTAFKLPFMMRPPQKLTLGYFEYKPLHASKKSGLDSPWELGSGVLGWLCFNKKHASSSSTYSSSYPPQESHGCSVMQDSPSLPLSLFPSFPFSPFSTLSLSPSLPTPRTLTRIYSRAQKSGSWLSKFLSCFTSQGSLSQTDFSSISLFHSLSLSLSLSCRTP